MIYKLKTVIGCIVIAASLFSCKKYDNNIDGVANTATAASSTLALNNRILAGFVVDANTLPTLQAGLLPTSYNKFRKLLTYDTVVIANKPPAYTAGDVITIVGYLKGDDFAISKRKINVSLFKAPLAFITPANPPSVVNVLQNAEDRYRSYQPGITGSLTAADTTFTLAAIAPNSSAPFNVVTGLTENINGLNYNTYLVSFSFVLPAPYNGKFLPGQLFSINFNAGVTAGDLGNVNWIYAFKIK
ncbi:hypothetical protein [Ferruginibacter sp.]|uniref:hypothetical protein n=1 Tax=Ferruginibacter sp. TaxID=1940288 RepID=UPI0019C30D2F|nr:hypothetical protein [Ferruginibacter sp.]MBC7627861.1 hypothetical protein [Ferruginibacter sp.]